MLMFERNKTEDNRKADICNEQDKTYFFCFYFVCLFRQHNERNGKGKIKI